MGSFPIFLAGRYADVVAVDGNPISDPKQFKKVSFVMKDGMVIGVRGDRQACRPEQIIQAMARR